MGAQNVSYHWKARSIRRRLSLIRKCCNCARYSKKACEIVLTQNCGNRFCLTTRAGAVQFGPSTYHSTRLDELYKTPPHNPFRFICASLVIWDFLIFLEFFSTEICHTHKWGCNSWLAALTALQLCFSCSPLDSASIGVTNGQIRENWKLSKFLLNAKIVEFSTLSNLTIRDTNRRRIKRRTRKTQL